MWKKSTCNCFNKASQKQRPWNPFPRFVRVNKHWPHCRSGTRISTNKNNRRLSHVLPLPPTHTRIRHSTPSLKFVQPRQNMVKKAVRFKFTDDQLKRIQSYFPDFAAKVEADDPRYEGRNAKITAWKQEKATALLDEPLFANLDAAISPGEWHTVRQNPLISLTFRY